MRLRNGRLRLSVSFGGKAADNHLQRSVEACYASFKFQSRCKLKLVPVGLFASTFIVTDYRPTLPPHNGDVLPVEKPPCLLRSLLQRPGVISGNVDPWKWRRRNTEPPVHVRYVIIRTRQR
jgi:hypothetical protein